MKYKLLILLLYSYSVKAQYEYYPIKGNNYSSELKKIENILFISPYVKLRPIGLKNSSTKPSKVEKKEIAAINKIRKHVYKEIGKKIHINFLLPDSVENIKIEHFLTKTIDDLDKINRPYDSLYNGEQFNPDIILNDSILQIELKKDKEFRSPEYIKNDTFFQQLKKLSRNYSIDKTLLPSKILNEKYVLFIISEGTYKTFGKQFVDDMETLSGDWSGQGSFYFLIINFQNNEIYYYYKNDHSSSPEALAHILVYWAFKPIKKDLR